MRRRQRWFQGAGVQENTWGRTGREDGVTGNREGYESAIQGQWEDSGEDWSS